jgi:hypothetical protein
MAKSTEGGSESTRQSPSIPPSGNSELDDDLKLLFDILADEDRYRDIATAVADTTLQVDEFKAKVPPRLVYLAAFLLFRFQSLRDSIAEEARPFLDQARAIINERFREVAFHPQAAPVVDEIQQKSSETTENPLVAALATVRRVVPASMWLLTSDGFVPAVRVALAGRRSNLLLDTSLSWGDLAFLWKSLAVVLRDDMRLGERYAQFVHLTTEEKDNISDSLRGAAEALFDMRSLAQSYGIDLSEDGAAKSQAREDTPEGEQGPDELAER